MNENTNNVSSMNEDENTVMASSLTENEGTVTLCLDETNTENEVMQTCVGDCQTGCDHDCSLDDCTICNPNFNGELTKDFIRGGEYKIQNYTPQWVFQLLSLSGSLEELANTFNNGPHFYKEIFNMCCGNTIEYNILLRMNDNNLCSISEINSII